MVSLTRSAARYLSKLSNSDLPAVRAAPHCSACLPEKVSRKI